MADERILKIMNGIRMKMVRSSRARGERDAAFTRLELFACMVCVALIGAMALPVLATTRSRSDIAQCLNNLRQIGRAVQLWGTERQDEAPWRVPVSSDGGTPPPIENAWFQFALLSNELVTPRILVCPADRAAKVASDFSTDIVQGYLSVSFRALATSYSINLHSSSLLPASALIADRNIRFSGFSVCPYAPRGAWAYYPPDPNAGAWTNAVHGPQGNVVLMDGGVRQTTSGELRAVLSRSSENGTVHLLTAR